MAQQELMSINTVATKLGLSVHQLRRWELMFGLEIKRGRGQQRQYRPEDLTVLERIKELVEQGWPTSQIRPQIEAEGLITPKLIGLPPQPGNPEVVQEAIIGLRSFCERRFIEVSKQIDELRQLVISMTLKQELQGDTSSPWKPVSEEPEPAPSQQPPEEITIGPALGTPVTFGDSAPPPSEDHKPAEPPALAEKAPEPQFEAPAPAATEATPEAAAEMPAEPAALEEPEEEEPIAQPPPADEPAAISVSPTGEVTAGEVEQSLSSPPELEDITDQNYLMVLGKALDLVGWSDEKADAYSEGQFNVAHWDELGRSQAEKLVEHLKELRAQQKSGSSPQSGEDSAQSLAET